MKKLLYILLFIVLLFLVFAGPEILSKMDQVINPDKDKSELYFGKLPEHKSDEMLLEDGEYMIELKEDNVKKYLTRQDCSSRNEIESLYKKAIDFHVENKKNYKNNGTVFVNIGLKSDIGMSMFINGEYSFYENSIESIKFNWYDDKLIFNNDHGNIKFDLTRRAYKGTNLSITESHIYLDLIENETISYLDAANLYDSKNYEPGSAAENQDKKERQKIINKLCDSIYQDLFNVVHSKPDTSETTTIVDIDISSVENYLNGTLEYNYASNDVKTTFNNLYSSSLEDEGAKDILEALVFEYTYRNQSTLNLLKFYVLVDANQDYAGVYVLNHGTYNCLWYKSIKDDKTYIANTLKFDMTNYVPYAIGDSRENTYLIRHMGLVNGIRQFNEHTQLIGVLEHDLPMEFYLFYI